MGRMQTRPAVPPVTRLSTVGQLYVTTVGVLALVSVVADSPVWHSALVVLTLPLSLLALWVGYYATLTVSLLTGTDHLLWPAAVVWAAVWTMTAWLNAHLARKVLRHRWRAVPARPLEDDDLDDRWI